MTFRLPDEICVLIYELLHAVDRKSCAHISSCFFRLLLQDRYRAVCLRYPGTQSQKRRTRWMVSRLSDPYISPCTHHVDLVVSHALERSKPMDRLRSTVDLLPGVLSSRRRTSLQNMQDLVRTIAGLPNLSHLGMELSIGQNPEYSSLGPVLSAVWPQMAPRLLSLHIHVHDVVSYTPLSRLDGGHLVQLLDLRITHNVHQIVSRHWRSHSMLEFRSEDAANIVCHVAKLVAGARRTLRSLRIDVLNVDLNLGWPGFFDELAQCHLAELRSLHITFPYIYVGMPELDRFMEQHASTLTSYHVMCRGFMANRDAPPNGSAGSLARHMQVLKHLRTLAIQLLVAEPHHPFRAPTPPDHALESLSKILDAMPDSIDALVLCQDVERSYLDSTDLVRLARMPATRSSLRSTTLGNLRSLTAGVGFITPPLFLALQDGLPLLENLRLHVVVWKPLKEDRDVLLSYTYPLLLRSSAFAVRDSLVGRPDWNLRTLIVWSTLPLFGTFAGMETDCRPDLCAALSKAMPRIRSVVVDSNEYANS